MRDVSLELAAFLDIDTRAIQQHLVTITLADATVLRWTDHKANLVVAGNTFIAGGTGTVPLVRVGKRRDPAGTEIGDCELVLSCGDTARIGGVSLPLAVVNNVFDRATVKIERVYGVDGLNLTLGVLRLFDGVVAETDPSSTEVTLSLVDPREGLNVEVPRTPIQPPCTAMLFDGQCTLSKAGYTVTGTVVGGAAAAITTARTEADEYFQGGVITFTSGPNTGVQRAVSSYKCAGGVFTFDEPLPAAPVVGDAFSVFPGCDKTLATCTTKFSSNQGHFRGFPFLPAETTDTRAIFQAHGGGATSYPTWEPGPWWGGIGANVTPPDLILPIVYGRRKVRGQIVYRIGPYSSQGSTAVVIAFAEGPIVGSRRCWVSDKFYAAVPLSIWPSPLASSSDVFYIGGRPTQSPWPFINIIDPAAYPVNYPGVAYWGAQGLKFPVGAATTYEVEIDGFLSASGDSGSNGDAHPASIIADPTYGLLPNATFGAGFSWPIITDTGTNGVADSSARRYLTAAGFLLSPLIDSKQRAIDILQEILDSCNCSCRVGDGALQIVPLGDVAFTANGVTYTPDTKVQYAIDENDYLSGKDEDPVSVKRPARETVYNIVPVEFTERNPVITARRNSASYAQNDRMLVTASDGKTHAYAITTSGVSASSQPAAYHGTSGEQVTDGTLVATEKGVSADPSYGYVHRQVEDPEPVDVLRNNTRRSPSVSLPMVCVPESALTISRLRAQRAVKRRNVYTFKVGFRFARIQPLDYLSISDRCFGFTDRVVRVRSVEENDDVITIEAEDAPLGMSHAIAHPTQNSESSFAGGVWKAVEVRTYELALNNWTERTIPAGVYYATTTNGSRIVAVGLNVCATSDDGGVTWTARTIPAGAYYGATWNGSVFCAVGTGVIATSPNGVTWTARTNPGGNYAHVVWNGSIFCTVGGDCATSPDGTTWTAHTMYGQWGGLVWNGSIFCAVGNGFATTSPDGVTWTTQTIPAGTYTGLAWNGSVFCAVGSASVCATSPDGVAWTKRTLPTGPGSGFSTLVWTGVVFIAACGHESIMSMDGVSWTLGRGPGGLVFLHWNGQWVIAVGDSAVATTLAV